MKYIKTFEKLRVGNQKELNSALLKYSRVKESLQLIRSLIFKGADVNCKNSIGSTPLLIASQAHFYSAIKLLIEKGADVYAIDKYGNNALILLVSSNKFINSTKECIDLLIEKDIDLAQTNYQDKDAFLLQTKAVEYMNYYYTKDVVVSRT